MHWKDDVVQPEDVNLGLGSPSLYILVAVIVALASTQLLPKE